jgi:transcriptional regulator GlxA family with amidase domain
MDARVQAVLSLMRQSLAGEVSMLVLSKSVNLSHARLQQLFKKETGQSPLKYLRVLRMQHAENLLLTTFLSVKEVACRSGMGDVSHFVRDFKTRYGLTPREFRLRSELSVVHSHSGQQK